MSPSPQIWKDKSDRKHTLNLRGRRRGNYEKNKLQDMERRQGGADGELGPLLLNLKPLLFKMYKSKKNRL